MYLDDIATRIRSYVPDDRMPPGDTDDLFRLYALLLRAKGPSVTLSDIHDAWSAWEVKRNPEHVSLIPYTELARDVGKEDRIFASAVQRAATELGRTEGSRPQFADVLFPSGPPEGEAQTREALDLYKIMVQSSESLVSRRQAVNTFFLTMNGALLTGAGIIVQSKGANRLVSRLESHVNAHAAGPS